MTTSHSTTPIRIAIGGLGAIGKALARRLAEGAVPGVVLAAVSAKNQDKARAFINTLPCPVPVLEISQLEPVADIVVECAPAAILGEVIGPFLRAKKKAIVLSVGAILFRPDLIELARLTGGTILVPTGALI